MASDADHGLLVFNHLEAHTSFNWLLLAGSDFKVTNWMGTGTLDYPWSSD